ncbi:MAG TPA: hypothetical protein VFD91_16430 [Mariniphaga sp.]|nr:hypothetical protein [Mariniphaga sp.]
MVRILGGGTLGCCQCGCNYEGHPGGSSTSSNSSANDAQGYTSDPGAHPCDCYPDPYPSHPLCDSHPMCGKEDMPCTHSTWGCPTYP